MDVVVVLPMVLSSAVSVAEPVAPALVGGMTCAVDRPKSGQAEDLLSRLTSVLGLLASRWRRLGSACLGYPIQLDCMASVAAKPWCSLCLLCSGVTSCPRPARSA